MCYCPFKILSISSTAENMPKIAEVKSSSCGLQKKLQLRNYGVAVAEQHFFKSCRLAIAEVLSSGCGIAIADSKKSCACPPLLIVDLRKKALIGWAALENHCCKILMTAYNCIIYRSCCKRILKIFERQANCHLHWMTSYTPSYNGQRQGDDHGNPT